MGIPPRPRSPKPLPAAASHLFCLASAILALFCLANCPALRLNRRVSHSARVAELDSFGPGRLGSRRRERNCGDFAISHNGGDMFARGSRGGVTRLFFGLPPDWLCFVFSYARRCAAGRGRAGSVALGSFWRELVGRATTRWHRVSRAPAAEFIPRVEPRKVLLTGSCSEQAHFRTAQLVTLHRQGCIG